MITRKIGIHPHPSVGHHDGAPREVVLVAGHRGARVIHSPESRGGRRTALVQRHAAAAAVCHTVYLLYRQFVMISRRNIGRYTGRAPGAGLVSSCRPGSRYTRVEYRPTLPLPLEPHSAVVIFRARLKIFFTRTRKTPAAAAGKAPLGCPRKRTQPQGANAANPLPSASLALGFKHSAFDS